MEFTILYQIQCYYLYLQCTLRYSLKIALYLTVNYIDYVPLSCARKQSEAATMLNCIHGYHVSNNLNGFKIPLIIIGFMIRVDIQLPYSFNLLYFHVCTMYC